MPVKGTRVRPTAAASDITTAAADTLRDYPVLPTPSELCDLLAHQVEELRALEGAGEDLDRPDHQARHRLVTIGGMARAFAELLDRHLAKSPDRVSVDSQ